jgi:hypothetical protein
MGTHGVALALLMAVLLEATIPVSAVDVGMATGNSPSGFSSPNPSPRRKNFPRGSPRTFVGDISYGYLQQPEVTMHVLDYHTLDQELGLFILTLRLFVI